jgi:nicotinate-nucleotide pyrophosphorylase (carboxylating)
MRSDFRLPDIMADVTVSELIAGALREDLATAGDTTTDALVPADAMVTARLLTREPCYVAGGTVAEATFKAVDPRICCRVRIPDGCAAAAGEDILLIDGPARGILTAERTALNFMQRMTGIATLTHAFVERIGAHACTVLDTRKTTPTLRQLEKYSVLCGGGTNHRIGLYDKVMIKDNHRRLWGNGDPDRLDEAVLAARAANPGLEIEIEVENERELLSALRGEPEWILLDNMAPDAMARCVALTAGRAKLEASGGVTLETVEAAAASGVDAVSLGCLTHSARAIDLSLEIAIEEVF